MKIELCEDNGFLNNGKPTLVVLVIDGRTRIPYEATKTIQQLYEDIAKMPQPTDMSLDDNVPVMTIEDVGNSAEHKKILAEQVIPSLSQNDVKLKPSEITEIEREDIVKCVKVYPRDEGADNDLEVDHEYRVISIKKEKGVILFYDIIDDNAGTKYRITCLPDEIELLRKRQPKTNPVKKDYFQEMMKCAQCGTENALDLVGDKYVGECMKCQARLEKERPQNAESATG